jgi:hypothetical protein
LEDGFNYPPLDGFLSWCDEGVWTNVNLGRALVASQDVLERRTSENAILVRPSRHTILEAYSVSADCARNRKGGKRKPSDAIWSKLVDTNEEHCFWMKKNIFWMKNEGQLQSQKEYWIEYLTNTITTILGRILYEY